MTEKTPEEITDSFMAHLESGDYKMNPNVIFEGTYHILAATKRNLLNAISSYTQLRWESPPSKGLRVAAVNCVSEIRKAWIEDLIRENPIKTTRLQAIEQENTSLKELNNKLAKENDHLRKQVIELHETIDRITATGLKKASGDNPP